MAESALPGPQNLRSGLLTAAASAALVVLTVVSGAGSRLDAWVYDTMVGLDAGHADGRIVLVEIDQASIEKIGRWPWSRRIHARLLDGLTDAGVRGVALDLLLSEPALFDPEGDALLARAIDRNGKVVLPVYVAPGASQGTVVELLPIREFVAAAAALGHVEQFPDADGKTRGLYLRGGVGAPRWPALALALQQLERADEEALHELDAPPLSEPVADAQLWLRERRVMLPAPFGREAHERFSYGDVLDGKIPETSLRGRWVLVTPVIPGLGPGSPGVAELDARMTAVDYQLAALDALVQERSIAPLSLTAQILLTTLLVTAPLVLAASRGVRWLGRPILVGIALAVLLSWSLLRLAQLWFAPGAALLLLALAGAAWAAQRLRKVRRFQQVDPLTGLPNRQMLVESLQQELRTARRGDKPLSLLLIGIDRAVDSAQTQERHVQEALDRKLSAHLRTRARRPRDVVARLGAGRFAILLPETSSQAAAAIATTIHVDLANEAVAHVPDDSAQEPLTTSIGMHTTHGEEGAGGDDLLAKADAARAPC